MRAGGAIFRLRLFWQRMSYGSGRIALPGYSKDLPPQQMIMQK